MCTPCPIYRLPPLRANLASGPISRILYLTGRLHGR